MSSADAQGVARFSTQVVILGGGIAGLWLLNRLNRGGHDAILLEKNALGFGQTLASQGIIHGGLKYALNGVLSPASSAIADMPRRWRACLTGSGEINLQGCQVLSPDYFMWSDSGIRSRLKTFLGSKALHGRIDALSPEAYPPFFSDALAQPRFRKAASGTLYRLTDFVVDTGSLLKELTEPYRDRIFKADSVTFRRTGERIEAVAVDTPGGPVEIALQQLILSAGEGNEALLQQLAISHVPMQRRPLHMVYVKLQHPHPLFVHCIGDSFGMAPRLTVTSHPLPEGGAIWYLGGELAEKGVDRSAQAQQHEAGKMLAELFPWVSLEDAQWGSFFIDRAEPRVSNLQRPDNAFVETHANVMIAWPTKLTLCPNLGDTVLNAIKALGAGRQGDLAALRQHLPFPGFAAPRWEAPR